MGPLKLSGRTNGVTVRYSRFDGAKKRTMHTAPIPDRLLSIYDVRHMPFFDWTFPWIEASLHLPCTSYIYITLPPFSFLYFQLKHIVKALLSTLSESDPFNTCTRHQLIRRISLIHRFGEYFLFTSPAIVLLFS